MRAVVQRVSSARVRVRGETVAEIGPGLYVLLGIGADDGAEQADRLASRIAKLRIFDDGSGRMNEPLDAREILCVSQFTLYGRADRGNRPGFGEAAPAARAQPLYERFCEGLGAERGAFGETMEIESVADGPVTILVSEESGL